MGSKLPIFKPRELIKIFEKAGFVRKRIEGSRVILQNPKTKRIIIIPTHSKDLKKGLVQGVIKASGISKNKIINLHKNA